MYACQNIFIYQGFHDVHQGLAPLGPGVATPLILPIWKVKSNVLSVTVIPIFWYIDSLGLLDRIQHYEKLKKKKKNKQ